MSVTNVLRVGILVGLSGCVAHVRQAPTARAADPGLEEESVIDDPTPFALEVPAHAPTRGPDAAPVTLTVFCDLQSPFCREFRPTLPALEAKYGPRLRLVFRHKLEPSHPNAKLAARASVAAHRQGRFWEFLETALEHQNDLDRGGLLALARSLGLNVERFTADMDSNDALNIVDTDDTESLGVGATLTPTIFINGLRTVGGRSAGSLGKLIDERLAQKTAPGG